MSREDILSYEEIVAVARAAAELGVTKLRLTGGEPLVRADLPQLVNMLAQVPGIDDLSLTTNGVLLEEKAAVLKQAGLRRVNVSLDSLRPERFSYITRNDRLAQVWRGIEAARRVGLKPVKLNVVVLRGVNDDEMLDFARMTLDGDWHIRFIELMPFGDAASTSSQFISTQEMKQRLSSLGELEPYHNHVGNGPARYFRLPGAKGTLGFISPVSDHFCISCNRLRLTADGRLRLCLLGDEEIDLRPALRGGSALELKALIERAVASKPERHHLCEGLGPQGRPMTQVGG